MKIVCIHTDLKALQDSENSLKGWAVFKQLLVEIQGSWKLEKPDKLI